MTLGELAEMFNAENRIGAKLTVAAVALCRRSLWYDETGLEWINPPPNLRSLEEAILYPGVGLVEGANVSVGSGTARPFELVGAPGFDGQVLARKLIRPTARNRNRQIRCAGPSELDDRMVRKPRGGLG